MCVLVEDNVNRVQSWLIARTDLTRGWAMILCSTPSFVLHVFVSFGRERCRQCFLSSGKTCFREFGCSICSPVMLVIREWERARAIEETGMIRQGMLRYHGNQMWLITEYIINFKRTELNEVQSREVIEVYAESSTTNRSLRFQGFKHCERDSRMLFHWSEQGQREENTPCFS